MGVCVRRLGVIGRLPSRQISKMRSRAASSSCQTIMRRRRGTSISQRILDPASLVVVVRDRRLAPAGNLRIERPH